MLPANVIVTANLDGKKNVQGPTMMIVGSFDGNRESFSGFLMWRNNFAGHRHIDGNTSGSERFRSTQNCCRLFCGQSLAGSYEMLPQ